MSTTYEYMDEASICSELICSICQSPFIDPQQALCDHTFCRQCITTWLQTGNTCPLCQQRLSMSSLKPSPRMIRNILDQLKVKCTACGQINLERGRFNQHLLTYHNGRDQQRINSNTTSNRRQNPLPNNHASTSGQTNASSDTPFIIIASCIFFGIIFHLFRKDSSLEAVVNTANKLDNDAIGMPISCTTIGQCPSRNVLFEHSYLLTHEHQTYLNYFYNDTYSRVVKWKLIYRGSIHGLNASAFHTHCDNQGETFIIMSTIKGYLFGGYVDANWTTSLDHVPTYNPSVKAFLFSLMNAAKTPAKKFSIDRRYRNYAIVNDISSGPIFGGMNQPDIGTYEMNGHFRCQIHFPSVYMSGIGISSFPSSNDCIINEMEVFIPVLKKPSTFLWSIFKIMICLIVIFVGWFGFALILRYYNLNKPIVARALCCLSLFLLWINYLYGQLLLLGLLCSIILASQWKLPNQRSLISIRSEKRLVMSCYIMLLVYITIFY
ncbi:hypothetical protein I4U23_004305 [Adineta vaga]|nr:hypothetical protein I4U23_004305 [Adineta vaga]